MSILVSLGIIVAVVILYVLSQKRKRKMENDDEQINSIVDFPNLETKSSVDDASKMLEKHKAEVSALSEDMRLWDNTKVLYKWSALADFINKNPFSIKFCSDHCPKCSATLSLIEYSEFVNSNAEILICKECKKQFDKNSNELFNVNNQSDLTIAEGDVLSPGLTTSLAKVTPRLLPILNAIKELNCRISIHNFEYLEFGYNDKIFVIWLEQENVLHFSNWLSIDKSNFTQDIIHKIQVSNQKSLSCTYWLFDEYTVVNKCYYLSSNIDLYKFADSPIDGSILKDCLDRLICEANKTAISFCSSTEYNCCGVKSHTIENLLRHTDCQDVKVDEDGDLNFKYEGYNMYVRSLDSTHLRVFWHCREFNDLSDKDNLENYEDTDMLALLIQWSNVAYPYKYTYYKPTNTNHSITAHLDLTVTTDTKPDYINEELSRFINFVNNVDFTDEDYILPIQDYYLPVLYGVKNISLEPGDDYSSKV